MTDQSKPEMGSTIRRMFVEGEWSESAERPHQVLQRLMRELDDHAAKAGMAVAGEVEIAVSEPSLFAVPRVMRLEADVVTR